MFFALQVDAQQAFGFSSASIKKGEKPGKSVATLKLNELKSYIAPDTLTAEQEKKVFECFWENASKVSELSKKYPHQADSVRVHKTRLTCEEVLGLKDYLTAKQYQAYRVGIEKRMPWLRKELEKIQAKKTK